MSASALRRRRPQLLVLATFLVFALVLLVWSGVVGRGDASASARGPVAISAALTQRMRVTLEHLPPEQHQGHGGHGGDAGRPSPLVCGTRVYGYEPADAATIDDVVTVYGFHMCAVVEAGRSWDWTTKIVAPLVMRVDTRPPTVQIAESSNGVSYRDRVKQLFPVTYQKSAFEQALEPDQLADLRRRYEAVAARVAPPTG